MASNGNEGQGHAQIQNTLMGVSHAFSMHEETDAESDTEEKIKSAWWKQCQPSPKEDMPSKESSESSSKEKQPTDKALCDQARQWAWQLDINFDAWQHKKIAKGIEGWAMRDTMICDLPKHGKAQPNHPDPVGPPLDYTGVFNSIRSDIYDLCWFYILGMRGDPPKFPAPQEPGTCNLRADQRPAKVFEMLYHASFQCKELQLGAILLQRGKGAASKGNGMVSSITLFLGEHRSQFLLGGIRLQQERLVEIREHQDRRRLDLFLQDIHGLLGFRGQIHQTYLHLFP